MPGKTRETKLGGVRYRYNRGKGGGETWPPDAMLAMIAPADEHTALAPTVNDSKGLG